MKNKFMVLALVFIFTGLFAGIGHAKFDLTNCMGAWLFDEGKDDVAGDMSDNKNDGKITGAKWADGQFGKALDFNGAGDKVDIVDNDNYNELDEITILSWVYLRRAVTSGTWNAIAGKNPYANGYLMWIDVPQEPCGLVYAGGARFDDRSGVQIELKRWYHLAFTRNAKGVMNFYIDGKMIKETASTAGPITINAGPLTIAGQSPQTLDGFIDEVMFFNTAMEEDVINSIMTGGLKGALEVTETGKLASTWSYIKTSR